MFFVLRLSVDVLESLLHSLEVAPVVAVKSKSPGHNTLDTAGLSHEGNLLGDELSSIPGPENAGLRVPVPLASVDGVGAAVLESLVE